MLGSKKTRVILEKVSCCCQEVGSVITVRAISILMIIFHGSCGEALV